MTNDDDHHHDPLPEELPPPSSGTPLPEELSPLGVFAAPESPSAGNSYSSRALPPDLRVPWDWVDLLLLVGIAFAGIFLVSTLLLGGLRIFGLTRAALRGSPVAPILLAIVAQIFLDLGLLGFLALQIRIRFRMPFWRTIGWRPLEIEKFPPAVVYLGLVFLGFFLVVLVSVTSSALPPTRTLPIETVFQHKSAIILYMLTAVLVAPLVEEVIFRGYLYPVAARSFGVPLGILFTGSLFGLMHAIQLWGGWWQILLLIFVGVVFTAVRAASRTIATSYVLHLAYNSVQVIPVLIALATGHQLPSLH